MRDEKCEKWILESINPLAYKNAKDYDLECNLARNAWNAALAESREREQAAVAAALKPAIELIAWYKTNHPSNPWPSFGYPNLTNMWLRLNENAESVTDSQSALDKMLAEARLGLLDEILFGKFGMIAREVERTLVYVKQAELRRAAGNG
jgi:hypothetical protein